MRIISGARGLVAALTLSALALAGCSQSEVREADSGGPSPSLAAVKNEAAPSGAERIRTDARLMHTAEIRNVDERQRSVGLMVAANTTTSGGAFIRTGLGADPSPASSDTVQGFGNTSFASEHMNLDSQPAVPGGWRGDTSKPLLVAQSSSAPSEGSPEQSAKCAEFAKDPDADVNELIRAGCQPSTEQMSALMDNPLGAVAMLFTQIDLYRMENPAFGKTANKWNYMGIAQFPKAVTKDWNLINRVVWNVPSMPVDQDKIDRAADRASRLISSGSEAVLPPSGAGLRAPIDVFDGRTTGFGDVYYVGLFSPKKPIALSGGGKFLWGVGFDLGFPTATDDVLGTGKWLAGPSALGVYLGPKWKIGALIQHYWDYAGEDDRDDVNMTNLQYFYMYSVTPTLSIGAAPNIIANWEQDSDNAFTVPVGLGINKTVQFGKVPVRIGAEVYYSVVTPDDTVGAEWNFRFYIIPAAPAALFKWMTTPIFGG